MPTLNTTTFNTEGYVLVVADWADVSEVKHATVIRRDISTGETVSLRPHIAYDGDGNLLLNCGIGIWWDTEAPLNTSLEYCTIAPKVPTILNSNSDFETGTAPWVATAGALTQSALNVKTGSFSGRFQSDGTAGAATASVLASGGFGFAAGVPVTLSAWALSVSGWNGVALYWQGVDNEGNYVRHVGDFVALDANEYRYLQLHFTPPADLNTSFFGVLISGTPPNGDVFHFDDIQAVQSQAISNTNCEFVVVSSSSLYLKSPLHPCSDLVLDLCDPMFDKCAEDIGRVSYAGHSEDEYDNNTVTLYPVNRRRPIPENRVRRDARNTLSLITHDCPAKDAVLEINEPGDPLFWQDGTEDYCIEDRYMSVATVTVRHIGVDQRDDFRFVTMPYVVVDRPEGPADGPCGTRFQDLCDIYSSWDEMETADLEWQDLPAGGASNESPGDPPLGALRTWNEVEAEFVDWDAVEAGGSRDWTELKEGA